MDIPHQSLKTHAKQISRAYALNPAAPIMNERPIISVLYYPHNLPVCWILQSNWHILQNSTTVGTTFCDRPLVAFKKDQNIDEVARPTGDGINQVVTLTRESPLGRHM